MIAHYARTHSAPEKFHCTTMEVLFTTDGYRWESSINQIKSMVSKAWCLASLLRSPCIRKTHQCRSAIFMGKEAGPRRRWRWSYTIFLGWYGIGLLFWTITTRTLTCFINCGRKLTAWSCIAVDLCGPLLRSTIEPRWVSSRARKSLRLWSFVIKDPNATSKGLKVFESPPKNCKHKAISWDTGGLS